MSISDWNSIFSPVEDDQYSFDYGPSTTTSPLKSILSTSYPASTATLPNVTVSATGTATSGATLMTSNGTLNWGNITYNSTYPQNSYTIASGSLSKGYTYGQTIQVKGDADFEGDVRIKGVNLTERLDEIEKRLAILRPNNDLEGRWEELKELGEKYRQLEQEILEKEKVWEILKK